MATVLSAFFQVAAGEYELPARIWQRLRDHVDRELEWSRGRESSRGMHSLLATFDGPARAIRCATAIVHHAAKLGVRVRAGLHVGECEIKANSIRGAAVDVARQMAQHAATMEILVSTTVRDLVTGSGIRFEAKGPLAPANYPGSLQLLRVDIPGLA